MTTADAHPVACTLQPASLRSRKQQLYEVLAESDEVRELRGGYALRFPWSRERAEQLGTFIALESECCAFLDFALRIDRGNRHIHLTLTGSADAKVFLEQNGLRAYSEDESQSGTNTNGGRAKALATFGAATSAAGLMALACCVLPAAVISAGSAAFFDIGGVVLLAVSLASFGAAYLAHRRHRCAC